jgi:hypothetical protein
MTGNIAVDPAVRSRPAEARRVQLPGRPRPAIAAVTLSDASG